MSEVATTPRTRLAGIDRLRGLAVLLMVLDHALVQIDHDSPLRYTITRLSLPLFVGCAAAVFRGQLGRQRMGVLALGIIAETTLNGPLSLGGPGPVTLITCGLLAFSLPWVRRNAHLVGTLGLLQALYQPVGWSGYQPGLILAYFALATLAVHDLEPAARRLPAWVGTVGRQPMRWYIGHLIALVLIVGAA